MNVSQGVSQVKKVQLRKDVDGYDSQRLTWVPDTPVTGDGISLATLKELVVTSTPCVRMHHS